MGLELRRARIRANLSLRELARRSGTSHPTLVAYESGRVDPGTKVADRILRAAGFEPRLELVRPAMTANGRATGDELADILSLAEHLPHRRRSRYLDAPTFPRTP